MHRRWEIPDEQRMAADSVPLHNWMGLLTAMLHIKSIAKTLLGVGWQVADRLVLAGMRPTPAATPTLLLIRLERIGDVVLWLPTAQHIIRHYKDRGFRVILAVAGECAGLVKELAGVDQIVTVDRSAFLLRPAYRWACLRRVRALGATEAILGTFSRVSALGDALIRASAARRRVGWVGDGAASSQLERRLGDSAYTEQLSNPVGVEHEMLRNEALPGLLGIAMPASLPPPQIPRETASGLPDRFYILAPGASQVLRYWPAESFAALARKVHAATGAVGIVVGSAGDRDRATAIAEAAPDIPIQVMTGVGGLGLLADMIARAFLVVTSDSAAVHFAAALGTPSVCITGGGGYGRFVPYPEQSLVTVRAPRVVIHRMACFGCDWKCPYSPLSNRPAPCVTQVPVAAVWEEVRQILDMEPLTAS